MLKWLFGIVDPELRAEYEANQKKNPMNNLLGGGGQQQGSNSMANFDAAAWLAGSGRKGEGSKEQSKEQGVSR
jgi:ER membrane protein complex subunit 7